MWGLSGGCKLHLRQVLCLRAAHPCARGLWKDTCQLNPVLHMSQCLSGMHACLLQQATSPCTSSTTPIRLHCQYTDTQSDTQNKTPGSCHQPLPGLSLCWRSSSGSSRRRLRHKRHCIIQPCKHRLRLRSLMPLLQLTPLSICPSHPPLQRPLPKP